MHCVIKLSNFMQLGQHSLYFASFNGDVNIVLLLIQRRANIDLPTDVSKLLSFCEVISDSYRMEMVSQPLALLVKRDI